MSAAAEAAWCDSCGNPYMRGTAHVCPLPGESGGSPAPASSGERQAETKRSGRGGDAGAEPGSARSAHDERLQEAVPSDETGPDAGREGQAPTRAAPGTLSEDAQPQGQSRGTRERDVARQHAEAAGGVSLASPAAVGLALSLIRQDVGCQPRADLSGETIAQYRDDMERGAKFPPVVVFHDGETYWLADGFHRVRAAAALGLESILAEVREGMRRDAVLYSVGANASHGLRRSNADKRRAVGILLADAEWSAWSSERIAGAAGVSRNFVADLRREREVSSDDTSPAKVVGKDGKSYPARKAAPAKAKPQPPPAERSSSRPETAAIHESARSAEGGTPAKVDRSRSIVDACAAEQRDVEDPPADLAGLARYAFEVPRRIFTDEWPEGESVAPLIAECRAFLRDLERFAANEE